MKAALAATTPPSRSAAVVTRCVVGVDVIVASYWTSPNINGRCTIRNVTEVPKTQAVRRRGRPGAMTMFMTAPMNGPVALSVGEGLLGCFIDAGLRPQRASQASYVTIVYVLGFLALDIAETDAQPPLPNDDDRTRLRQARIDHIDPDRYPLTADTATTMAAWVTNSVFDWGLHALLDGITRPRPRPASRP